MTSLALTRFSSANRAPSSARITASPARPALMSPCGAETPGSSNSILLALRCFTFSKQANANLARNFAVAAMGLKHRLMMPCVASNCMM